ncbi:hypothetical protein [Prochlorococcus marinus]|nr:hypothetical protein [Prochlorococcus marinus]
MSSHKAWKQEDQPTTMSINTYRCRLVLETSEYKEKDSLAG